MLLINIILYTHSVFFLISPHIIGVDRESFVYRIDSTLYFAFVYPDVLKIIDYTFAFSQIVCGTNLALGILLFSEDLILHCTYLLNWWDLTHYVTTEANRLFDPVHEWQEVLIFLENLHAMDILLILVLL